MDHARSHVIALTLAQSAAAEHYERIVDEMFDRTAKWVDDLEESGTVSTAARPLHRFIGEAIGIRTARNVPPPASGPARRRHATRSEVPSARRDHRSQVSL